jgi:hypothetical protein
LVQHDVDRLARAPAILGDAYVAVDELEVRPPRFADCRADWSRLRW